MIQTAKAIKRIYVWNRWVEKYTNVEPDRDPKRVEKEY